MAGSEPSQLNSARIQPVVGTWTKRRSERWLKLLPRTRITRSGQRGRRGSLESSEGGAKGLVVLTSQRIGRAIFIEQEDVKLAATAFLRAKLKGLSVPFSPNLSTKH
jgi:hypothetical protein